MFCSECGTKNENGSAFCEKCGHKLEAEKETKKVVKKVVKNKKPMSKGKKVLICAIVVVVAALIGAYMYIGSLFKPEKIAVKYFKAYMDKNVNALCDTISLDESDFVNKKLLKESFKDLEKVKIANYKAEKQQNNDSLSTTVTIKYVEEGSSKERTANIRLVKNKNKKWLFFDNWSVDSDELIVNDYTLSVPKDAEVTINGISLSDKYKKDAYSSYYDSYTIPSILKGEYEIIANVGSGIKLSGKLEVKNSYSSFSYNGLKLEEKTKETIEKELKEKLKTMYDGTVNDKSFDDIKESFSEDYRDDFENTYNNLKNYVITDYKKLKEFNITDLKVGSYSFSGDELRVNVQIKYDYKIEYKSGDETKEYSTKGKSATIYGTYKLDKKNYTLSKLSSLVSYFSYYNY